MGLSSPFKNSYKSLFNPEADGGISILDNSLGIDRRIPTEHANLSECKGKKILNGRNSDHND